MSRRISPVIPGFGLTLGYTLVYLSLLVLIPLGAMFLKTTQLSWEQFWAIISAPRVLAALKLSFGTALAAAVLNGLIGTLLAWVLVRYEFPGRKIIDAMIDLPFALPTAVAGIALTALYAPAGLVGQFASDLGFKIAYTPGDHPGADFRDPAVRGPHGAAGARRHSQGSRGSRRLPRRQAAAGVPPYPRAGAAAGLADRFRPGLRPGRRRTLAR